jgi:hypothetical protein
VNSLKSIGHSFSAEEMMLHIPLNLKEPMTQVNSKAFHKNTKAFTDFQVQD